MKNKMNLSSKRALILMFVTLLGIFLRYLGRDTLSGDFVDSLNRWYLQLVEAGPGIDALAAYSGDYPYPYIFFIWLLSKVPLPFLYSLKLANLIFDILLAVIAGKIAAFLRPQSEHICSIVYCIVFLSPNVFFNSAYWGQCDGMCTLLLLLAFYLCLKERYAAMMFLAGATIAIKLQGVFILPFILILYWIKQKFSIVNFLLIPAAMLVMNIPAMLAGIPILGTFSSLLAQTGYYPWLYYFYPNFWFFFQTTPSNYYMFGTTGILLAVIALLIFVLLLVKKNVQLTNENSLLVFLWTAYTCVMFLPSMHERYGFLSEILFIILAAVYYGNLLRPVSLQHYATPLAIGISLCIFPKYLFAIHLVDTNPLFLQALSAIVNCAVYMIFTCLFWKQIFQKDISSERSDAA